MQRGAYGTRSRGFRLRTSASSAELESESSRARELAVLRHERALGACPTDVFARRGGGSVPEGSQMTEGTGARDLVEEAVIELHALDPVGSAVGHLALRAPEGCDLRVAAVERRR